MSGRLKQILQIAATYIGTVVGAGFATGREIVEFFTIYGSAGFVGIFISGFLFIVIGTKLMLMARRIGASSFDDMNRYLFGTAASRVVNILMLIMLFGVTGVMLSGSGALFYEQLQLPFQAGVISTLLITFLVMKKGINGILWTNSLIVPVMILFSFVLSFSMFESSGGRQLFVEQDFIGHWKWIVSPFTYAAFNLTLAQAVLVPLSREAADESIIKWGGFVGGLGLTFILLNSQYVLYSVPRVLSYEIPIAEIVGGLGIVVHYIFVFVIYGEIFSTLIGNLFGLAGSLNKQIRLSNNAILILLLVGSYMLSQVGYAQLLHFLYPVFGMIALVFLVVISAKKLNR
ncbi:hypothetical protein KUV80_07635 [Fictibacillus nanhaiensis]|uniref:YkvI family membrane protein n=1 Tax=Fictibacillus nanhaiensis TaxID=742169 RepID=UPI001C989E11|nr:hypothetical protein [Fictibacillus nanhaiensis]MBY6036518.1 hypothetical protein [Fictibacillus nanhaiensis]